MLRWNAQKNYIFIWIFSHDIFKKFCLLHQTNTEYFVYGLVKTFVEEKYRKTSRLMLFGKLNYFPSFHFFICSNIISKKEVFYLYILSLFWDINAWFFGSKFFSFCLMVWIYNSNDVYLATTKCIVIINIIIFFL